MRPAARNRASDGIDDCLISAIDPDARAKLGRMRQHLQEHGAVHVGLARRTVGQHGLERHRARAPERGHRLVISRMNRRLQRKVDVGGAFAGVTGEIEAGDRVDRRLGVGHAHHRGDAADRGGRAAAREILLLRLAGVAHVDVRVDETGKQHAAARVDDGVGRRLVSAAQARRDPAVRREDCRRPRRRRPVTTRAL